MDSPPASVGRGFRVILVSTVIAGAAGYLIQAVAGWWLAPDEYAGFGVFWATLYFLVGAVAGIQQEIARAARPVRTPLRRGHRVRLLAFAAIAAFTVAAATTGSAVLWAEPVFGDQAINALVPLTIGAMSYVGFATLSGVLYGRRGWGLLAVLIMVDPILRLLLVVGALASDSTVLLDWAIVAPIPVTLAVGVCVLAARRASPTRVDRPVRELLGNAARTVLGSAATAVLISALPLFIAASASSESAAEIGALIFNVTITRAPLVIPILAFQGWLVVHYRDEHGNWMARVVRLLGGIALAGILLSRDRLVPGPAGRRPAVRRWICAGPLADRWHRPDGESHCRALREWRRRHRPRGPHRVPHRLGGCGRRRDPLPVPAARP